LAHAITILVRIAITIGKHTHVSCCHTIRLYVGRRGRGYAPFTFPLYASHAYSPGCWRYTPKDAAHGTEKMPGRIVVTSRTCRLASVPAPDVLICNVFPSVNVDRMERIDRLSGFIRVGTARRPNRPRVSAGGRSVGHTTWRKVIRISLFFPTYVPHNCHVRIGYHVQKERLRQRRH
jgi:hypothetical protein